MTADAARPPMLPRPPMLEVTGLDAYHGRAQVAFSVDLAVPAGSVVALLGRNGAGKSTILKAIAGLVTRTVDRLALDGVDVGRLPTFRLARAGLGYVPEDRRIFTDLTVAENLEAGRQPPRPGVPHWTPARLFDLFPNLAQMGDRPAWRMSGGEQQMLTIARTLMGNPRLLLLDEPSEGLSPRLAEQMARAISDLKREGLSILLSEQNLAFARLAADQAVVIARGTVRFAGSLDALSTDEGAQSAAP